ncbi:MAG: polysaccharide deacetylase family protein [Candidatus Heimdallarchaeota archaeon]|nr:polysaccharide deacetylase family protein [Candidatus Heimdallarchaeota archaeon]
MDEWYQCRWASGSKNSIWDSHTQFFESYYNLDHPVGEIIEPTKKILKLFDRNDISATFFFTGEIASYYPDLVKEIKENGHEIGLHNMHHQDYNDENISIFKSDLMKSKLLLEKLTGDTIIGYRAPNSVVSALHIPILIESGILYDSSITPTRPLLGKFGKFSKLPINPYKLSSDSFQPGKSTLWEFPWPVFPYLKLPSGSGITMRIFGYKYSIISLNYALKTGHSAFYFHPYELKEKPKVKSFGSFEGWLTMQNLGNKFEKNINKMISKYKGSFINGRDLLKNLTNRNEKFE